MWISLILFLPSLSHAASCCGGGASATGIMTGDTSWMLKTSYSDVSLIADSNSNSEALYRTREQVESIRTTNINYTHLLTSLWQIGIDIPIVEKVRKQDNVWVSQAGAGDLKLVTAYEFMPIYDRGIFPRGFLYTGVSIPTAPSIFTSNRPDLLDARGTGHYYFLLGTLFEKRFEYATVTFQPQLSYREGRKFSEDNFMHEKVTTKDSLDHLISLSISTMVSENIGTYLMATRNYMESKATSTLIGTGQKSLVHDFGFGLSYAVNPESDLSINYTDQFLAGESYNHTLGRSLGVSYVLKGNL